MITQWFYWASELPLFNIVLCVKISIICAQIGESRIEIRMIYACVDSIWFYSPNLYFPSKFDCCSVGLLCFSRTFSLAQFLLTKHLYSLSYDLVERTLVSSFTPITDWTICNLFELLSFLSPDCFQLNCSPWPGVNVYECWGWSSSYRMSTNLRPMTAVHVSPCSWTVWQRAGGPANQHKW